MSVTGWTYYNHAMVPTCAPHEQPNINIMNSSIFWKPGGGIPLFARWTDNFDCGYETEWWYTILDHPFDINSIKAKHRYYIKQGLKNFDVKRLTAVEFKRYRTNILEILNFLRSHEYHLDTVENVVIPNENQYYLGAFEKDTCHLVGWALITEYKDYVGFTSLKVLPEYEKKSINAGIVYTLIDQYNSKLDKDFYITNGTRTINHPTQFNTYLRRMFEFRKAYCILHIKYRWFIKPIVKALYPIRKQISKRGGRLHQVSAVLKMEEIARSFM